MIHTRPKDELVIFGIISALSRAMALTGIAFIGVVVIGLGWREMCGVLVLVASVIEAWADARRESFVWHCSDCGGVYRVERQSVSPYRICSCPQEIPS